MMTKRERQDRPLADADYRALAEFRYQLRQFLLFSEDAARQAGLAPRQHQALYLQVHLDLCAHLRWNGHPELNAASSFTYIEQHPQEIRSPRQNAY